MNNFKKSQPNYEYTEDPKTPYQKGDSDQDEIDPVARENMLKNKAAFNMGDLQAKLNVDTNNTEFNKKRKNHYKNEFRKANG